MTSGCFFSTTSYTMRVAVALAGKSNVFSARCSGSNYAHSSQSLGKFGEKIGLSLALLTRVSDFR